MDAATETVELSYTMTADDVEHGMRTRSRCTRSGRLALAAFPVCVVLIVLVAVLFLALGIAGELEPDDWTGPFLAVLAFVMIFLVVVVRRRIYRQLAERMGNVRASVNNENVRIANDDTSSVNNWSAYGSCVETEKAFVLMSPDKRRIMVTVLPKRGLGGEADARRLREILARRLG